MKPTKTVFTVIALLVIALSCNSDNEERDDRRDKTPEELAQFYCSTCHKFPEPGILPRSAWREHVLPRMACFYGRYSEELPRTAFIEPNEGGKIVDESGIFPKEKTMDDRTWEAISDYYLRESSDDSIAMAGMAIRDLEIFDIEVPNLRLSPPSTTMLRRAPGGGIYLANAHTRQLLVLDGAYAISAAANVGEGAVALHEDDENFWVTVMGSFSPTDNPSGYIMKLGKTEGGKSEIVIQNLQRPVHSVFADLNNDGLDDVVVSEFGKWTGGLSLFAQQPDGSFNKIILHKVSGAIRSEIHDLNNDGLKDVIALFGQGDEGIDVYLNRGNFEFERQRILRFSSANGSSWFGLQDIDGDGDRDILYTAGDNADYTPVMKPYHGIYCYENRGDLNFELLFFHYLNGAYKAIAEDFDRDGDLDIAAISFFPDWANSPGEGFIYLEHQGEYRYTRRSLPLEGIGRWIIMEPTDIEGDGDTDLLLGSLAFEAIPDLGYLDKWVEGGVPFILLKNRSID